MHAVTKPMPVCPVSDRALHVKSAVLKWVGLEDKMMADRRAFRECSQTNIDEFAARSEIGMSPEAGIVFKLQKNALELVSRLTHHCEIIETGNESWRFKNRA